MMILDELWNGNISPCELRYEKDSEYDAISSRISGQMAVLRQNASKRQRKLWEAYDRDLSERETLEQQEAYYQGVRFGARFMMDVLLAQSGKLDARQ